MHRLHPRWIGFGRLPCLAIAFFGLAFAGPSSNAAATPSHRPNFVIILADDLGYGEIGCQGQKWIRTPNIDQMAREGLRFTQFYAGATVCAPSRSVLMTGQHHGHTRVRGNAGPKNPQAQRLTKDDITIAKVLQGAGYHTALFGKWGLGLEGDSGHPNRQGFDEFFGFLSQHHAHNHYPDYLWRNSSRENIPNAVTPVGDQGGGYSPRGAVNADDLFTDAAVEFLQRPPSKPFFLYLSLVNPHANNERTRELGDGTESPASSWYQDQPWSPATRGHAAMVSHLDACVGRVLAILRSSGLDRSTLVLFTSDNGPHRESKHDVTQFEPSGPFRGFKRDLYEGGIRVPGIFWWPGKIAPGRTTDHPAYFGDYFATAAELADCSPNGRPIPLDSISLVPTLFSKARSKQPSHSHFYWEFHEGGFVQALLMDGRWKVIQRRSASRLPEVYDVKTDPGERRNLAALQPDLLRKAQKIFATARSNSEEWPIPPIPAHP